MSEFLFGKLIARINDNLINGLPGEKAHLKLAPQHRQKASVYLEKENNYKTGCVMALLYPDEHTGEARLILIERTGGDQVHAGQIGFPGGKIEVTDESNLHAALREAEEEIGVDRKSVKVLGALSSLYIPPSKFLVYPFIGIIDSVPEYKLSEREVRRIITPLFSHFVTDSTIKSGEFISARGYSVQAPFYDVEGVKIWGATAMMISELVSLSLGEN